LFDFLLLIIVVSISASDCLERCITKMAYNECVELDVKFYSLTYVVRWRCPWFIAEQWRWRRGDRMRCCLRGS